MQEEQQLRNIQANQDTNGIPDIAKFEYSKCNFECRIYKKKMISSQQLYCYISEDYIAISDEPYKKLPDKIIGLTHDIKVQWVYNKTQQPYRLTGFIFKRVGGDEVEYVAEEEVLKNLKQVFMKRIFQSRFQDEYEVISQVGKGNYARVYSIKHRVTGKKFAVKCFEKQKLLALDKGIQSLYNELKIMRKLDNHNNVIKLHETFEGENTYYFVMEIVEGASLYDEIKKHSEKKYTDNEILNVMRMLVEAMAYCAKHNIMHRDLKPENILFAQRGIFTELKIVDFGLATVADESPYIFPKCGTPGFVAPEIANLVDKTQPYQVVCDMFSVGVIFHILLTGESVFPGKKFNEVLKKNKACEISLTGTTYEFISNDAKDLLLKMLQKDPKNRISAEKALKEPYFTQTKNNKQIYPKHGSHEKLPSAGNLDEGEEDVPQVRPKKISMFTKAPRIPYLKKEDNNVDPKFEELNSFVTKEPIWAGEKQNELKKQIPQIQQIPDNGYYTIGSLDQHKFPGQAPQQPLIIQQQQSTEEGGEHKAPMSKVIRKNSSQNDQQSPKINQQQKEPIKESLNEEDDEMEEEKNNNNK